MRHRGRRPRSPTWRSRADASVAVHGGLRGRRPDRGRQAGRAGGAPGRGQPTRARSCRACWPGTPRSPAWASPTVPASSTASTRAPRACWWWPARQRPTRPSWPSCRRTQVERRLPGAGVGRARRPPAAWSTPPSAGRPASPPAWPCRPRASEARTRYEVVATYDEPVAVSLLDVPARDRPHPPDPGAPDGHRAPGGGRRPLRRAARGHPPAAPVPARRPPGASPTR